MASMALSNSTLSGCFDPTLERGFTDFLLVHAGASAINALSRAINAIRRDIRTPEKKLIRLSAARLRSPLSAEPRHSSLDRRCRTRRCPPPEFPPRRAPHRPPYRAPPRHLLQFCNAAAAARGYQLTAAF